MSIHTDFEIDRQKMIDILFSRRLLTEPDVASMYAFQYQYNEIFRTYCNLIHRRPKNIGQIDDLAYLPISLFKSHMVKTGSWSSDRYFESSSTTGLSTSKLWVRNYDLYLANSVACFKSAYGPPSGYCFLALLPSYLERANSSLIDMVTHFIDQSDYGTSQFYLDDLSGLRDQLLQNLDHRVPTILWGVSYALLDFAEIYPMDLQDVTVIETGGMKGRRTERSKRDLHSNLKEAFGIQRIHSEYGMTELFSQAYSKGFGLFDIPSSMYVTIRSVDDPQETVDTGRRGRIHIIDMANIDTCAFIATDDLGVLHENGQLEILGRLDGSEQRGCNLMV